MLVVRAYLGCPYTELNTTVGMNTVAYADYHVEVVESHLMLLYFSLDSSMLSGCCKKCNNLFFVQLSVLQHILYMS